MSISLYNSNEMPFGALSNNAIYLMNIDNIQYNTVTNFIYSNILSSNKYNNVSIYNNQLRNDQPTIVPQKFIDFSNINENEIIAKSLSSAYVQLLKTNSQLKDILLSSSNRPILFNDTNESLGIGLSRNGRNLVGNYLTQIKKDIQSFNESDEELLYKTYVAYSVLKTTIINDNQPIDTYTGLTIKQIIEKYIFDKSPIEARNTLSQEDVIQNYRQKVLNVPNKNTALEVLKQPSNDDLMKMLRASISVPDILISYLKKMYYNNLRLAQLQKVKDAIFNIYLVDLIRRNYPQLPEDKIEEFKKEQLGTYLNSGDADKKQIQLLQDEYLKKQRMLDVLIIQNPQADNPALRSEISTLEKQIDELKLKANVVLDDAKDKIYEYYKADILPPEVNRQVELFAGLNSININDVMEAENIDIGMYIANVLSKTHDNTDPLFIGNIERNEDDIYIQLSPFYEHSFSIDSILFSSVAQYVIVSLISSLPMINGNFNNAYKLISYLPGSSFVEAYNVYNNYKKTQYNLRKKELAKIALSNKFCINSNGCSKISNGLKRLLKATANANIIWADKVDEELGIGFNSKGKNYIGDLLVEYRNRIKPENIILNNISISNFGDAILNEPFLLNWVENRVKDISKVLKVVNQYVGYIKLSKDELAVRPPITPSFTKAVLSIYFPCEDYLKTAVIDAVPPIFFNDMVRNNLGVKTQGEVLVMLWMYILNILLSAIEKLNIKSMSSLISVITRTEILLSTEIRCIDNENTVFNNNKIKNCILNAILNIIYSLFVINSEILINTSINTQITQLDVDTSVRIILNRKTKFDNLARIDNKKDNIVADNSLQDIKNEDDIESSKSEIDYDDESDNQSDAGSFDGAIDENRMRALQAEYQSTENSRKERRVLIQKINTYIRTSFKNDDNYENISNYIIDAIDYIIAFRMPLKIKHNRINFFGFFTVEI